MRNDFTWPFVSDFEGDLITFFYEDFFRVVKNSQLRIARSGENNDVAFMEWSHK